MSYDILIVGAGISGIVLAERFASIGKKILIIDKNPYIGGLCRDGHMKGVLVHFAGPHGFRTNSKKVKDYLSKFTEWREYELHNRSYINGKYYTFPINMNTINEVFGTELTLKEEVKNFIELLKIISPKDKLNSEEYVLHNIGKILYEMFYKYYTIKQWGLHPKDLPASICGRVPVYYDDSDIYVEGKERIMPKDGYTEMFKKMLDHPNITLHLNTDFWNLGLSEKPKYTFWTGRIDEFFGYKFGKLPYRSLRFEYTEYNEVFHQKWYKIAYPTMDVDQTRDIEIKRLTGQVCANTVIMREFPESTGEPFYPIPTKENLELYQKYKKEADQLKDVIFIGRCSEYLYKDMDECVLDCLNLFENIKQKI